MTIRKPEGTYVDYFNSRPLSASAIKLYLRSPELFAYNRFDDEYERTESAAAKEGTDLHCAVLEPSRYAHEYRYWSGDRRTKVGKEQYARLMESGYEIRKREEMQATLALRRRCLANPTLAALLDAASDFEKDLVFQNVEEPQLRMVARIDALGTKRGIEDTCWGLDLKSVRSADAADVSKTAAFGRWDVQEAVYRQALEASGYGRCSRFYFGVIEREPPYRVRVLELGREEKARGMRDVDYSATCIVNRYKSWDWDSIGESKVIEYPGWFRG